MRWDSLVETARGPVLLKDIVPGDKVLTHKSRYRAVSAVHDQGVLPILKITTHSGRVTHAAPSHPYLTPNGWVEAGDLKIGDVLATVVPEEDRLSGTRMAPEEARLLGYIVGDGSVTTNVAGFTNADLEVIADFERCAAYCGFKTGKSHRKNHWHVRLHGGGKVHAFLDKHGLRGKSSYDKRIPAAVMSGRREVVANFVGAYWTCDGGFDVRPTGGRESRYRAYGTTVSRDLANDLVYALGILGIESRLRERSRALETARQPGGIYRYFSIEVQKEEMTGRFADLPGLCTKKKNIASKCRSAFSRPLWDDHIISIEPEADAHCLCLTVEEDHSFTCSGIAVKNTMKSLLVSVFWPAWEWGPGAMPWLRYLGTSYDETYARRDSRRMRDLVSSSWYQALWPMELTRFGEGSFENTMHGSREAKVFANLTGGRGNRLLLDDPHSVDTAESVGDRLKVTRRFRESLQSRLNDQKRDAIIVIMQRLHERDVCGVIEELGLPYVKLILPMEFEPKRKCITHFGGYTWEDPRTEAGELLDEGRFPRDVVDALKIASGSHAYAGQYQQRPTAREGGLFKRQWFQIVDAVPAEARREVRRWDLAATIQKDSNDPDWTVGLKMATDGTRFYIKDVVRFRDAGDMVRRSIKNTASVDGHACHIEIPQDPGQAGKDQAKNIIGQNAGFRISAMRETGDKGTRAEPFGAQLEAGNVYLLKGDWNEAFIEELCGFPVGHDDQVDAASGAFAYLTRTSGPLVISKKVLHRAKVTHRR